MFNNIILKISILSFMTGIRHTDVRGISGGNPDCPPPVTCGDSPVGACGSASLRRHLRCFGSLAGNLADAPVRPCWAFPPMLCPGPDIPGKDPDKSYGNRDTEQPLKIAKNHTEHGRAAIFLTDRIFMPFLHETLRT